MRTLINLATIFLISFIFEWIERKVRARIQRRMGPSYPFFGILQPFFDFFKLIRKESLPKMGKLFSSVVYLKLINISLISIFIPVIYEPIYSSIIAIISILGIDVVFGLSLAYISKGRYSTIGGGRLVLQSIAIEIPLFLSLISPYMKFGYPVPSITQTIALFVAFICILADSELLPFDIPIAEQEIVAGWITEFSGRNLAILKLASNMKIASYCFLIPWLFFSAKFPINFLTSFIFIFIISIVNSIFPRFKISNVVSGSWKFLFPAILVQMLIDVI